MGLTDPQILIGWGSGLQLKHGFFNRDASDVGIHRRIDHGFWLHS
jgi:hypothetical protein